jgi:bifunctional ADP-heptose synthase (sugar kinase/adenylyltransferase)
VSGAGDTAIAFYTLALAAELESSVAVEIANHAASVVVGKVGTATVTPEELIQSFEQESATS